MEDLYEILGIKRNATEDEIKKAHRRLVKIHHPDKNSGKQSPEFHAIQQAYDVLSDPESRARYDEEEINRVKGLIASLVIKFVLEKTKPYLMVNKIDRELRQLIDKCKKELGMIEASIAVLGEQKDALKLKKGSGEDIIGDSILKLLGDRKSVV